MSTDDLDFTTACEQARTALLNLADHAENNAPAGTVPSPWLLNLRTAAYLVGTTEDHVADGQLYIELADLIDVDDLVTA